MNAACQQSSVAQAPMSVDCCTPVVVKEEAEAEELDEGTMAIQHSHYSTQEAPKLLES